MTKILITGAGALLGQGIFRALRRSSLDVRIAAADPSPLSAALYWGDEAYLLRMASDPGYLDRLAEVLDQARPDVLIPGTDVELPILAAERERLEQRFGTRVLVSDPEVIAIADDKYRTFEFFRDAGLHPPGSALPEDHGALASLVAEVGFPLVVKPRVGARSVGVSVVHDAAELEQACSGRSGLVVQECVGQADEEYTSSVLVFDGRAEASIVMRRDLRDGNTYRAFADDYPELNAQVKAFGTALKPFGPANFQFRTDAQGRARVFEINGRFSGATPLRALVGFNEVEMCLRRILYGEPIMEPPVDRATILRHWSETLVEPDAVERLR
jgi:carbamoyl-phosphate synthase large subunit